MSKKLKATYPRLGEILVRRKAASPEVVDHALAIQRAELAGSAHARRIGEILVEHRVLDRVLIREILEEQKLARGETRRFRISLADEQGVARLALEGRLDRSRVDSLTRILERLMNRGFARIAIDASRLAHIDAEGVSALVPYVDESRARGGDVKFFGVRGDVVAVFAQLGLDRFVQIFDDKETVLRAFDLPIDEYMSRGALGEYVGDTGARQFHLSYCPLAQKIAEPERVYYESKWHARKDARRPCGRCKP